MEIIKIEVSDLSKVSDGYHTIQELYDHRCLLWIALCMEMPELCYIKKDHYEGWFLLGCVKEKGFQMSYHCPNKYLDLVEDIKEDNSVEWDGHTPSDVLQRIYNQVKGVE